MPLVNNFTRGSIAKFLLELAMRRSFTMVFKHSKKEIFRFGLTIGLTAMTFHAVICLLRRLGKKKGVRFAYNISRKLAIIIAAVASAVPMFFGLMPNEQNLIKLIFYPLAFRCVFDKTVESGWIVPFKHGDILAYVVASIFVAFTYTQERQSCPPSLFSMIEIYSQMGPPEFRAQAAMKTAWRAKLAESYFPNAY